MLSVLKFMGAAAVISSAAMAGFVMSGELRERIDILREIQQSAVYIKSEIEYRSPVFEECFRRRGRLFSKASEYIGEGLSPSAALKKSADETARLTAEDKEIIYSYADGLDAEEVNGQTANVSLLISHLGEDIREAEAQMRAKGRLYRSGGVLAGIGFVIILL